MLYVDTLSKQFARFVEKHNLLLYLVRVEAYKRKLVDSKCCKCLHHLIKKWMAVLEKMVRDLGNIEK